MKSDDPSLQNPNFLLDLLNCSKNWEDWIDTEGVLRWINPAASDITRFSTEECLAMKDYPAPLIHPDDREYFLGILQSALNKQASQINVPFRVVRKDNSIIWIAGSWSALYGQQGDFRGLRGSYLDISQSVQNEQERNKLNDKLQSKINELESIIQIATHDLRSPLVNIDGFVKELERELDEASLNAPSSTALRDIMSFLRSSVTKMFQIISGLQKIERLGRVGKDLKIVDMNALIDKIIRSTAYRAQVRQAQFEIAELEPCLGNTEILSTVFTNLIDNAIKYLDHHRTGHIQIDCSQCDGLVDYRVKDNGIGIAPEHQDLIFNLFYRVDSTYGDGEGLGLCAVRRMLAEVDGEISVQSVLGEGSCFSVRLPAANSQSI